MSRFKKVLRARSATFCLGFSLLCLFSCKQKVHDTSGEPLVVKAKGTDGNPAFAETPGGTKAADSDRLRSDCLGMSTFESSPRADETELKAEPTAKDLNGRYGLQEFRFYSEVLSSGLQSSSAGSITTFEQVADAKSKVTPRVLCQNSPNAEAGTAQGTFPGILQFPASVMSKILLIKQTVQNAEYKVSGNFRPPLTKENKLFRFSDGEKTGAVDQYRVFRGPNGQLRIRFLHLEALSKTDIQLRLDAEAFYGKL